MVNLGYSVQENWAAFNATNDLLMETHWTLLEGAAAKTPYPAVNAARPGSAVVRCGLLWFGVLEPKGQKALDQTNRGVGVRCVPSDSLT